MNRNWPEEPENLKSHLKSARHGSQTRISFTSESMFAQDCLATGVPMLVENIEEELDPVLDPVFEQHVIRKGKNLTMQLADKEVSIGHSLALLACSCHCRKLSYF